MASEKSARAQLPLAQPGSGAHFLSSWAHVLVLSYPSDGTHPSTDSSLVSQVTEMPKAGEGPRRSR